MIYSIDAALTRSLPNVAATNGEYLFWAPHWQTIRDCLMGEIVIKARGQRYLPRTDKQTDNEYKAYLERGTFYNATARTVAGLVAAVHTRAPIIDNLPDVVDITNVTNDGQSFDMFMKRITKETVSLGRYGVMIDAPPEGGAPYCVGYDAEDIVDWAVTRVGSREKIDYVVLREISRQRVRFTERTNELVEHYRVLFIDEDGIYKQRLYRDGFPNSEYEEFTPLMQGRPMTEIPFLFIGPYDFGSDVEKPPILDIALLNLSHYRAYAQLEAGRFYTAMPVYSVFLGGGGDEDAEFVVGPNVVWQLGREDKVQLDEFEGKGLSHLESGLKTLEQQIAALGGKLATPTAGTAAESSDAAQARERSDVSFLGSMISMMSEAASRILSALALWHGVEANVTVSYASDATQILLDGREIRAMAMLYDTGLMPMETIFQIFRQNNIIRQNVTFEQFKEMLPQMAPKVANKVIEAEEKAKIEEQYAPDPAPVAPQPKPKASHKAK
jgi:Domain of unknown function (DUF4055)